MRSAVEGKAHLLGERYHSLWQFLKEAGKNDFEQNSV